MGRQALIAVLCWVTIQETLAVNLVLNDNLSAESVKRLYRNVPFGMYRYANAAPYGAYTYQVPYVMKPAASRVVPVQENVYLKDSYGNKYVQSPQSLPLKPLTPQQFLQLQALPPHLVQPLSATPLNFNYKQASGTPQIVYGSHYKLPVQPNTSGNHYVYEQSHPALKGHNQNSVSPSIKSQFYGSILQSPQYSSSLSYAHPTPTYATIPEQEHSAAVAVHHQSTSDEAQVYTISSTLSPIQYTTARPHYAPDSEEFYDEEKKDAVRSVKAKLKKSHSKVVPVKTVVNGRKAVVKIETKPTLPLLDISLLEPLTFDNPIVPQVQHYLPRINDATYHKAPGVKNKEAKKYNKEFVVQKTKHYDSGYVKQKKTPQKKKHIPSVEIITYDEIPQASTARPTIAKDEGPEPLPEISYEINSPTYKETYKEQAVKYNKETNSEPVHYSYDSRTNNEPTHYSYVHSSKEPIHIKEIHYEGPGPGLKFNKPPPQNIQEKQKSEDHSGESEESSEEEDSHQHQEEQEHVEPPKPHHSKAIYREEEYHHAPNSRPQSKNEPSPYSGSPSSNFSPQHGNLQPVAQYEEEIRLVSPENNNQNEHVQQQHLELKPVQPHNSQNHDRQQHQAHYPPQPHTQHNEYKPQLQLNDHQHQHRPEHNEPQHHHQIQNHPRPAPQQIPQTQNHPVHVQEKTKQIYIKEESPSDEESVKDFLPDDEIEKEQDFEKGYKNAAFGFPAYNSHDDGEKDIYNPENYGVPRQNSDYKQELSPFREYFEKGDNFPKSTRLNYLDTRDKTKDNYFLDFSINQPQFMADRYTKKVDYLKLYQKQKEDDNHAKGEVNPKPQKSEKYSAIPYDYYAPKGQTPKPAAIKYAAIPFQEYDFSKGEKRDNFAFATKPLYTYKINTHFVEPQFQYGFEPIALPRLLDSELAAMASNVSPESEKPGLRKKIYKENFYIKKTSSNGPNS